VRDKDWNGSHFYGGVCGLGSGLSSDILKHRYVLFFSSILCHWVAESSFRVIGCIKFDHPRQVSIDGTTAISQRVSHHPSASASSGILQHLFTLFPSFLFTWSPPFFLHTCPLVSLRPNLETGPLAPPYLGLQSEAFEQLVSSALP